MKKLIPFIPIVLLAPLIAFSQTVNYEVYAIKFAESGHASPISAVAMHGPDNDSVKIFLWFG